MHEERGDEPWEQAGLLRVRLAVDAHAAVEQGVRLTRARLAVRQDGPVVPLEHILEHGLAHVLVHLLLSGLLVEHAVERVLLLHRAYRRGAPREDALHRVPILEPHEALAGVCVHVHAVLVAILARHAGTDAREHVHSAGRSHRLWERGGRVGEGSVRESIFRHGKDAQSVDQKMSAARRSVWVDGDVGRTERMNERRSRA